MDKIQVGCPYFRGDIGPSPNVIGDGVPCECFIEGGTCKHPYRFLCTEYFDVGYVSISDSRLKTMTKCPRKFYHAYVLGYRPIDVPDALGLGSMVHKILEGFHAEVGEPEMVRDVFIKHTDHFDDGIPLPYYQAGAITRVYLDVTHTKITPPVPIEAWKAEQWFEMDFDEDRVKVTGRIDLESEDGKTLVEHKYTAFPDSYNSYTLQFQLGLYFMARPNAEKAILNMLVKPNMALLRKGKRDEETRAEHVERVIAAVEKNPKKYFKRKVFYRNEFDFDFVKKQIYVVMKELRWRCKQVTVSDGKLTHKDMFWQNRQACQVGWQKCEYMDACHANVDPSEMPQLYRAFKPDEDYGEGD